MLSKAALESFKKIYFEEFKVLLSDETADMKGKELLQFISLIYKPTTQNNSIAVTTADTNTSNSKNMVVQ
ncbi:hypothetical protein A2274_00315 [candidate division WWE3 bacterium RIFOXYA12_FULL_43_11]|uniref:Uncharacterized protein n=2 Tax=Katanobacteria TaxID=422282 RepID=A0A0G0Y1D7_UNCKA|nr:MAG: hypothetical protein UR43_C0017G0020 [candidate division TM6 bacterium GW2011_GWF2_33_332]KKS03231.1 MAG: hypothetical protein UU55_C0004G0020 [candidate division WWE3 bacterium GW2011_GWC2_41_23]OGC58193.1 MAG: hypothetical protein A2245_00495 [candidate division WWE3 bacterium RIFOXYA2_FULL_43_12]OGC65543.1 MAG: hypothetical protein A2274_00315 [candidate division WWE3 bacterium RIFOXYA12_FULL_43_11]HBY09787.1 hypothetical protein [candidate division WWE3 bacterium]HLD90718.1 hypothe